ncbi:hypothetical protein BUALT_Bualt04G0068300 [Buddleja alternifolia]|uniref:Uncharacterized protein n=1 Tax=Buddleja alternifolia TaxID=168488 RepID=A0AAV6XLX2_9LAMI|nr:hypothetical protein BUALT_Bualt04G0068300 [Buddleja alternifolia]
MTQKRNWIKTVGNQKGKEIAPENPTSSQNLTSRIGVQIGDPTRVHLNANTTGGPTGPHLNANTGEIGFTRIRG